MAKFIDLLKPVLERAGIDLSKPEYKDLVLSLAAESKMDATAEAEFSQSLSGLIPVAMAAKNPEVVKAVRGETLSIVDKELAALMSGIGFDETTSGELAKITSTYERMKATAIKAKEHLEKAIAGASKGDKEELVKKIQAMNAELASLKADHDKALQSVHGEYTDKLKGASLRQLLAGQNWANKEVPQDVNEEYALLLLNKKAAEAGASISYDAKTGKLRLVDASNPELDFHQNHKPVALPDFLNKIVADSKLVQASSGIPPVTPPVPPVVVPDKNALYPAHVVAAMDAQAQAVNGAG